jgi:hypothetical protein
MPAMFLDLESQAYPHPARDGVLLLLAGIAFVFYGIFGKRFRVFGFRLPEELWATLASRILYCFLGLCLLLSALHQLWHVR